MSDHNDMSPTKDKAMHPRATARIQSVVNQEPLARKVSSILGEACAAAQALKDYERRQAAGEQVIIFSAGGRWIVGAADKIAQALAASPMRARRALKVVN